MTSVSQKQKYHKYGYSPSHDRVASYLVYRLLDEYRLVRERLQLASLRQFVSHVVGHQAFLSLRRRCLAAALAQTHFSTSDLLSDFRPTLFPSFNSVSIEIVLLFLRAIQLVANAFCGFHDIGVGFFVDLDFNALPPVYKSLNLDILVATLNHRDIVELDVDPVFLGDHN